jgi:hypothetical protein
MFKAFSLVCSFSAMLVCAPQLWAAEGFDLATADWSVTSPHNLAVNPPTDDMGSAVLALVKKLDPETTENYSDLCPSDAWKFVDLHHSGTFSLVVGLSDGRFYGENLIIDKAASGFREYDLSSPSSSHFSGPQVEDLSGKGDLVVIEFTDFTDFNGMNTSPCIADFPVIFAWTGDGYTDVSNQHKQYYEQQLASLKAQVDGAETPPTTATLVPTPDTTAVQQSESSRLSSHISQGARQPFFIAKTIPVPRSPAPAPATAVAPANVCTKADAAKIERFLGIDKDAGFEDAAKWADSSDRDEWIFAVAVLKDIGTPSAIDYLRTLSNDTSGLVATHAKAALQSLARPPAPNTIEQVDVIPPEGPPE